MPIHDVQPTTPEKFITKSIDLMPTCMGRYMYCPNAWPLPILLYLKKHQITLHAQCFKRWATTYRAGANFCCTLGPSSAWHAPVVHSIMHLLCFPCLQAPSDVHQSQTHAAHRLSAIRPGPWVCFRHPCSGPACHLHLHTKRQEAGSAWKCRASAALYCCSILFRPYNTLSIIDAYLCETD
jgi:hypothetical protein